MHSKMERRSRWYYLLATIAFAVVVLAIVQMVQLSGTALASAPAQAKGGSTSIVPSPEAAQAPEATAVVHAIGEGFEAGNIVFTQFTSAVPTCVPGPALCH